jgi:L-methionine (R)-S-oxide reductase
MTKMILNHKRLLHELRSVVSSAKSRPLALQAIADRIRAAGGYRWVGLYDVDRTSSTVKNVVWSGPGAPEYPVFPITSGLTSAAISTGKTINVGNVASDPRYLTAFGSTKSEIIVPVLNQPSTFVVGTIDVESENLDAFTTEIQQLLEECSEVIRVLWRA